MDYSGRKRRDGQKKKISKANERRRKVKRGKDEEVNGQGGKRSTPAHMGEEIRSVTIQMLCDVKQITSQVSKIMTIVRRVL